MAHRSYSSKSARAASNSLLQTHDQAYLCLFKNHKTTFDFAERTVVTVSGRDRDQNLDTVSTIKGPQSESSMIP